MSRVRVLVAGALAVVVVAGTGCRTTRRVAQQPVQQQPAPYAYAQPTYPTYPSYPTAPPPPESFPSASAPSPELDDLRRTAEMQEKALDAERKARELAEERARRAESLMASAPSAPAYDMPPAMGDSGEQAAAALAEHVRTRSDSEIVQAGNTVVIRISDSFRAGSDQLKPEVRHVTTMQAVAEALLRAPSATVAVIGHSDGTPITKTRNKWTDNTHLSRARADTVARILAEQGVPAARITVDGRGEVEPLVYPERTSGDRARNRRVEIHIRF